MAVVDFLDENEVSRRLSMPALIEAMEHALIDFSAGRVHPTGAPVRRGRGPPRLLGAHARRWRVDGGEAGHVLSRERRARFAHALRARDRVRSGHRRTAGCARRPAHHRDAHGRSLRRRHEAARRPGPRRRSLSSVPGFKPAPTSMPSGRFARSTRSGSGAETRPMLVPSPKASEPRSPRPRQQCAVHRSW